MARLKYYIVDVFAQKRFTGNQVAVVEVEEPLSDEVMREIAQEMNFRETSFVSSEPDEEGFYSARIFTPEKEVAFSGHPTLGTAFVINHFLSFGLQKEIKLKLKSGNSVINCDTLENDMTNFISKKRSILLSDQKSPEFGHIFEPVLLSRVLGIEPSDIDQKYPIQEVFSGLGFIIIPLRSLNIIKSIKINHERLNWLTQKANAKILLTFCSETVDQGHDVHTRVFGDYYHIPEDAASGAGAGSLAAYCIKYNCFDSDKIELKVEQGYEMGRPSLLIAKATKEGEQIHVNIGGRVILTAQGEIVL